MVAALAAALLGRMSGGWDPWPKPAWVGGSTYRKLWALLLAGYLAAGHAALGWSALGLGGAALALDTPPYIT
ncbi:MAG TPA: hypothetical protein VD978_12160 [Azospirillum sp.]|nr:hypothetical protein [Azospirillum sp.]